MVWTDLMEFVSCSLTSLQNVEIFKVGLLVKYVFLTERKICEEKSWIFFTCYLRQNSFCVHDTHFWRLIRTIQCISYASKTIFDVLMAWEKKNCAIDPHFYEIVLYVPNPEISLRVRPSEQETYMRDVSVKCKNIATRIWVTNQNWTSRPVV